jgi:hypothetical protein
MLHRDSQEAIMRDIRDRKVPASDFRILCEPHRWEDGRLRALVYQKALRQLSPQEREDVREDRQRLVRRIAKQKSDRARRRRAKKERARLERKVARRAAA